MTALANETALDVAVDVRFTPSGMPLAVRHDGRIWPVTASPVHWFGEGARWDTRRTAVVSDGSLGGVEYWRVQARLGSSSALRTFTLRRNPPSTQWLLDDISDGG